MKKKQKLTKYVTEKAWAVIGGGGVLSLTLAWDKQLSIDKYNQNFGGGDDPGRLDRMVKTAKYKVVPVQIRYKA